MKDAGIEGLIRDRNALLLGDQVTRPFEADTILPSQYWSKMCRREHRTGEHRLMLGILEDAVNVYCQRHAGRLGLRAFREVEKWFTSPDTSYVFSFERICETLGLDASWLRRGLRDARARNARQHHPMITIEHYEAMRAAMGE